MGPLQIPDERRLALERAKQKLRLVSSPLKTSLEQKPLTETVRIPVPSGKEEIGKGKKREYVAEDPLTDATYLARGLIEGILYIPQRIAEIVQDPADYWKWFKKTFGELKTFKESGSVALDALTENYKDNEGNWAFGDAIVKRPFSTAFDAFFLKSIVSKSAATAAKAAGGVSRARLIPEMVQKLGPMTRADRVLAAAEAIDRAPWPQIKKGISALASRNVSDGLGVGKHTPVLAKFKANEFASESMALSDDLVKLASRDLRLTPGDKILLRRAIRLGRPEDIGALGVQARKWYDNFRVIVLGPEGQELFLKGKGLLTEGRALAANAIVAAQELFGKTDRASIKAARNLIREGKINPTFASLFRVKESGFDLLNSLGQDYRKLVGKYGRLEKRVTGGVLDEDIVVTAVKQAKAFHSIKARVRWLDRVMDYLERSGEVRIVTRLADLPEGYAVLPHGLFKKYYEVAGRAIGAYWRHRQSGVPVPEAARKAFGEVISDPILRREALVVKHIAVPKHVARYIELEFAIPSPGFRIYDRLFSYWKALATIFRPQYWLSVASGNGLMAAIEGVGVFDAMRIWKNKGVLPPEIRSRLQTDVVTPGVNAFERVAGNFREYASAMDEIFLRQPVFSRQVEVIRRETHAALMRVGASGFAAFDALDDPVKFQQMVAVSTEGLSTATRRIQGLYDEIGNRTPEAAALKRELDKLYKKINKLGESYATKRLREKISAERKIKLSQVEQALTEAKENAVRIERSIQKIEANVGEHFAEIGKIERALPELEQMAAWADEAIVAGNRLAGDYMRLHPLEKKLLSRAIPFWPYMKTMALFVARLPFLYPSRYFLWNRWARMVIDQRNMEEFPEWLRDYIPVGHTADGSTVYIRLASWIPWTSIRVGDFEDEVASLIERNPAIKVVLEFVGATPRWSKRPWSTDETMTRLDNGEVYRWVNGRFKKAIPRPSVWRSLWYLFPTAQLIEEIFVPYVMTDRGWLGFQEPRTWPDGTPMYPKQLAERLLSAFGPRVIIQNESELKRQERARFIRIARSFQNDIRRAPPEKREAMIQILRDAMEEERRRRAQ